MGSPVEHSAHHLRSCRAEARCHRHFSNSYAGVCIIPVRHSLVSMFSNVGEINIAEASLRKMGHPISLRTECVVQNIYSC